MIAKRMIPVVAYIRMSSSKQEKSPDRQRDEIRRLAEEHGYKIIREYFDEAITGTGSKPRPGFEQMILDADRKADFQFILVEDQDRFSRFDATKFFRYCDILRDADVKIHTVAQGIIQLDDIGELLKGAVVQHGKRQYVQDLSRKSLSGRLNVIKSGQPVGKIPYGYDRAFYDAAGNLKHRCKRGSGRQKGDGLTENLIPNDDESEIVRWIFSEYATTAKSTVTIVNELNERSVHGPSGGRWHTGTLVNMLQNRAYVGTLEYGKKRTGMFHRVSATGHVAQAADCEGSGDAPIVIEDAHEPIVSFEVFDAAQSKLRTFSRKRTRTHSSGYPLTGILVCGHCGYGLGGTNIGGVRYYRCGTASNARGKCHHFLIPAEPIEKYVIGVIESLLPELDELRAAVEQELKAQAKHHPNDEKRLRRQLSALERKIERGRLNVLEANPVDVPFLNEKLDEWRADRDRLKTDLESLGAVSEATLTAEQVLRELQTLQEAFQSSDVESQNYCFRNFIREIELRWERKPRKNKLKSGHVRFMRTSSSTDTT